MSECSYEVGNVNANVDTITSSNGFVDPSTNVNTITITIDASTSCIAAGTSGCVAMGARQ